MANSLMICLALCAFAATAFAFAAPSQTETKAAPIYLGYNATYCRGLNFTIFDPRNCSAFYQCQGNHMWYNYCQYPLLYNHLNGFCDHPWNVRCNRASAKGAAAPPTQDNTAAFLGPDTMENAGTWAAFIGYNATFCRGRNFTTYDLHDCTAFYQCYGNQLYWNICLYPFRYNHLTGRCDYASNVNCNRDSKTMTKGAAAPSTQDSTAALAGPSQMENAGRWPAFMGYNATFCRGRDFTTYDLKDCTAFYQCQGNQVWWNICMYPYRYNHLTGLCDNADNVNCNRDSKLMTKGAAAPSTQDNTAALAGPSQMENAGRWPAFMGYNATFCRGRDFTTYDLKDCTAFYQCQGNQVWWNICLYPYRYNHLSGLCDYPDNVSCNHDSKMLTKGAAAPSSEADKLTIRPPVNQCLNQVNCFVAPCQFAKCPNYPGAKCFNDYCGGCNARWFLVNNVPTSMIQMFREVTGQC
jgi:uncharacterized membrane protein